MKMEVVPERPASVSACVGPNGAHVEADPDCIVRIEGFEDLPQLRRLEVRFPGPKRLVMNIDTIDGNTISLETDYPRRLFLVVTRSIAGGRREYLTEDRTWKSALPSARLARAFSLPDDALRIPLSVFQGATAVST